MGAIDLAKKGIKFAKSPQGKKIGQAGLKFIRKSGLGTKAVNFINDKVSKKTAKNPTLDILRQGAFEKASEYVKSRKGTQSLPKAALGFVRGSGLGSAAVESVNKKISKKTGKIPAIDTIRKIAHEEASSYLSDRQDKSIPPRPTRLSKTLFQFRHPEPTSNPPAGKHPQSELAKTKLNTDLYTIRPGLINKWGLSGTGKQKVGSY
jgi:hypothetical protein